MKKALWIFPALALGTAALFSEELYRYTFCRSSSPLLAHFLDKKGHGEDYYQKRDAAAEALRKRPRERMEIRSARGNRLVGYYYPGAGDGKRIAFFIHGYRSEHAETAGLFYDLYCSLGFDLFCCDHSAHGESEGQLIGFDVYESADCLRWIDMLRRRFGEDIQVLLHGFSMGSATVLKMSGDCPDCVKAIVSDCGYMDGAQQLKSSLGAFYPLMRTVNRLVAGYDLKDTDVRPSLLRARLPILFVHGRQDRSVSFENAEKLYALYPGEKDCLFIDDAKHMECIYLDAPSYRRKLAELIERSLSKEKEG